MKQTNSYINIHKKPSMIKATDDTIFGIVDEEIEKLGRDADLNHIDVSKVTKMCSIIGGLYCGLFEARRGNGKRETSFCGDVSKWNVSKVKKMSFMFDSCVDFNCDLSEWDVSNVEQMNKAFYECKKFNCDISKWDVRNCLMFTRTFKNTSLFCDLSGWEPIDNQHEGVLYGTPMYSKHEMWPDRWRPI